MSDRQIILSVFAAAPVIAILSLAIIFRDRWMPTREPPTDPVRVAATPDPAPVVRPVATQPATRPSQPQKADGATALLKRWAESLPKQPPQTQPSIAFTPSTKPASPKPPEPPKPPTIDEFEKFARRFTQEYERDLKGRAERNVNDLEHSAWVTYLNADIVKTDSVAYPLVGVLRFSQNFSTHSKDAEAPLATLTTWVYEFRFALSGGRWRAIKVVKKLESHRNTYGIEGMIGRVGEEKEESPELFKGIVEASQK